MYETSGVIHTYSVRVVNNHTGEIHYPLILADCGEAAQQLALHAMLHERDWRYSTAWRGVPVGRPKTWRPLHPLSMEWLIR